MCRWRNTKLPERIYATRHDQSRFWQGKLAKKLFANSGNWSTISVMAKLDLNLIRQMHHYPGLFFAPAIIFFALTGAMMTFDLHESRLGRQAPAWIAIPAQVHKKQTIALRPERHARTMPRPSSTGGHLPEGKASGAVSEPSAPETATDDMHPEGPAVPADRIPRKQPSLALKWFFLFAAVELILITILGIYMSFKYTRNHLLAWVLLVLGTVIPLVLICL
jgi:hypothetical protein